MDTGGTSGRQLPVPPAPRAAASARHTQRGAVRLAAAPPRASMHIGRRLWRSPLGAPLRRPAQALVEGVTARAVELQPLAIQAMWQGVDRVLASPAPETLASALVAHGVLERMAAVLLDGETVEHLLDIAEREDVVKRLLAHSLTERFITELGETEHVGHLVAAVMQNDQVVEAVRAQGAGFVGVMAVEARSRGVLADDALERFVRALLRLPGRPAPPPSPPGDDAP